jgi:cell division septation protein DedD
MHFDPTMRRVPRQSVLCTAARLVRAVPLAILCAFIPALADVRTASSEIAAFLSSGDFAAARHAAEKAYGENPSDPACALLYAKTMQDAAKALEAYKKIAADTTFPDSVRSEAYFRLGCAAHIKGRYQKAGGYLKKADGLAGTPVQRAARFLNAVRDTADSAFAASLAQQAADTSSYEGKMANYCLGLLYLVKKDFTLSLSRFNAAAGMSDTLWWSCGAYAGAYYCAITLGRPEEAASVLRHMKRVFPSYLERAQCARAKPLSAAPAPRSGETWFPRDTVAKKEPAANVAKPSLKKTNFCLQVGAFGSAENAGALKTDLAKRYSPVSVVAALVQDKPIYRVRVGVFASRETAQAFGDSALAKKGLLFRIVEDVPVE